MYTLKGFALFGAQIDNQDGVVATIGELSPLSKTFSKELKFYRNGQDPSTTLVSFTSKLDGAHVEPDGVFAQNVLSVLNWIYAQAVGGEFSSAISRFEQLFLNRWGSTVELQSTGPMVQSGSLWCPESITFSFRGGDENTVRIWFSDTAFNGQFDETELSVILPLIPVDQFFDTYYNVLEKVNAIKQSVTFQRIEDAKAGIPETLVTGPEFYWTDPTDRTRRIPVTFPVIIWGLAGNNYDTIKQAIVDEIMKSTDKTRDEWAVIFPDLFTSTEFILVPGFRFMAIPNMLLETGLYSPVMDFAQSVEIAKKVVKGDDYTQAYIDESCQGVPTTYKNIPLTVVGSPNNRDGITRFSQQFTDYLSIAPGTPDYARMSLRTQKFILQLITMLIAAEQMTPNTSVPNGLTRLVREGVVYVSKSYENVQYHVVTRYSLNDPANGFDNLLVGGTGDILTNQEGDLLVNNQGG